MKKYIFVACAVALLLGITIDLCAFTSLGSSVTVATVDLSDWPEIFARSIEIRRLDGTVVSSITWSGINPGDIWRAATCYIVIHVTATIPGWGVQIYTDNLAADADPRYGGSGNPAGLVGVTTNTAVLPMCWKILDETTFYFNIVERPDHSGFTDYGWKFLKDRNTTGDYPFQNGEYYIVPWNENGILYGEAPWERAPAASPNYIYFGANFANATKQAYRTNKLILEWFTP